MTVPRKGKNPPPKKYKRRYPENLTLEMVLNIINRAIDSYILAPNSSLSWGLLLTKKGLYKKRRHWWSDNYPEVKELIEILRDAAGDKKAAALIDGKGNVKGLILDLKCNHGWVEEEKRLQLDTDKDIANMSKRISIGYSEEDDECDD